MTLHRYPSAAEAIEAVREFLGGVTGAGGAEVAYLSRVAANLLAMVERELAATRGDDWMTARLAELDVPDEASLAALIRAGELDDREEQLRAVLTEITDERLRVANPSYLVAVHDDDPRSARPAD